MNLAFWTVCGWIDFFVVIVFACFPRIEPVEFYDALIEFHWFSGILDLNPVTKVTNPVCLTNLTRPTSLLNK